MEGMTEIDVTEVIIYEQAGKTVITSPEADKPVRDCTVAELIQMFDEGYEFWA